MYALLFHGQPAFPVRVACSGEEDGFASAVPCDLGGNGLARFVYCFAGLWRRAALLWRELDEADGDRAANRLCYEGRGGVVDERLFVVHLDGGDLGVSIPVGLHLAAEEGAGGRVLRACVRGALAVVRRVEGDVRGWLLGQDVRHLRRRRELGRSCVGRLADVAGCADRGGGGDGDGDGRGGLGTAVRAVGGCVGRVEVGGDGGEGTGSQVGELEGALLVPEGAMGGVRPACAGRRRRRLVPLAGGAGTRGWQRTVDVGRRPRSRGWAVRVRLRL